MDRSSRFTPEMVKEYVAKGYWTEDTTSRLWEYNAKRFADKEAFVSSRRRLSWSQAKQMSDRLAVGFIRTGLKKGQLLFLLVPNCCESYIIRVACEKAGILCATALMTGLFSSDGLVVVPVSGMVCDRISAASAATRASSSVWRAVATVAFCVSSPGALSSLAANTHSSTISRASP